MAAERNFGILALGPSYIDDLWRPEHFLLGAAAKYVPVVWMNPPHTRDTLWGGHPPRAFSTPQPENIIAYRPPLWLPHLRRPEAARQTLFRLRIKSALALFKPSLRSRIVLSLWRPWPLRDIDLKQFALTTYHATDLFADWGVSEETEFEVLRAVDQTFTVSRALFERCSPQTARCADLPNGVDYELFSKPMQTPADLASIPAPRLVYAGVVKTELRLDLVADIAERLPHCSVVLVGSVKASTEETPGMRRLRQLPNVHLLGPKSITELPGYLQAADVGLLPYQLSNYTNHISPMKLNEYLATGVPCIGSPIEPLLGYDTLIDLAVSVDEWVAAIQKNLEAPRRDSLEAERRRSAAREFDWDKIARRYLTILSQRLEESAAAPRRESVARL